MRPAHDASGRASPFAAKVIGPLCVLLALPFLGAHHPEARVVKLRIWRKRHRYTNPKRKRGNGRAVLFHLWTTTPLQNRCTPRSVRSTKAP